VSGDAAGPQGAARESVGPAREEAARLLDALSAWAAGALGPPGSSSRQEHAHDGSAVGASTPGSSAECRVCPVCSAISAVRGLRPEVVEHLLDAGGSLLAALRAGLELPDRPAPDRSGGGAPAGPGRVERIDIG
jgi:hypothetical protein